MPHFPARCLSLVAAIGSFLAITPAQSLTISAAAIAPVVVHAQAAASFDTDTQPVGPLPAFFGLGAGLSTGSGSANVSFVVEVAAADARVYVRGYADALGVANPFSEGSLDVELTVQAPSQVQGTLFVRRTLTGTAGVGLPLQRIDVGNDGSFEITESAPAFDGVPNLSLGPTPLPVRVLLQIRAEDLQQSTTLRSIFTTLELHFVADNQLSIQPITPGCAPYDLVVEPSFVGNGLQISGRSYFSPGSGFYDMAFVVLGTGVQPVTLPSSFSFPGCLLLPSPEIVVPLPPFARLQLPLPAAVRPITFLVQGVDLWGSGLGYTDELLPTNGCRVTAF
jgi:hypothetical protein